MKTTERVEQAFKRVKELLMLVKYWTEGKILDMNYKTDCHTFDATVEDMNNLKYNNLLESYGTTSPVGSKVLEVSPMGKYMKHNKGTLGPQLYGRNLI